MSHQSTSFVNRSAGRCPRRVRPQAGKGVWRYQSRWNGCELVGRPEKPPEPWKDSGLGQLRPGQGHGVRADRDRNVGFTERQLDLRRIHLEITADGGHHLSTPELNDEQDRHRHGCRDAPDRRVKPSFEPRRRLPRDCSSDGRPGTTDMPTPDMTRVALGSRALSVRSRTRSSVVGMLPKDRQGSGISYSGSCNPATPGRTVRYRPWKHEGESRNPSRPVKEAAHYSGPHFSPALRVAVHEGAVRSSETSPLERCTMAMPRPDRAATSWARWLSVLTTKRSRTRSGKCLAGRHQNLFDIG